MVQTRRILAALLLASPVLIAAAPRQAAPQPQAAQTALDRYVAAPDANFSWKVLKPLPAEGATATLLEMTSQKWLTEQEVERPLWTHWLTVVRPPEVKSDVALLYITGGSLERQPPSAPPAWLVNAARDTGTVTVELRLVPNQPVVFKDDPDQEAAHRRRLHRLYLGQVPAHRRREMAGAAADDQERGARDGRRHAVRRRGGRRRAARSPASSSRGRRSADGRPGPPRPSIDG